MPAIYQPLPDGSIRLLRLHPRQDDSLISCSFTIHNISDEASTPGYVALSYAWGSDHPVHRIFVEKEIVMVRQNLYDFLLQCGYCDAIWIDALCIDQQDNAERSQQVQMMGSIYSSARVVWAWLGPARDPEVERETLGVEVAKTLASLRENASRHLTSSLNVRKTLIAIGMISYHDYWTRAWIVKEFLLARKVQLLYGDTRIDPVLLSRYRRELEKKNRARNLRRPGTAGRLTELPRKSDYVEPPNESWEKYGYVPPYYTNNDGSIRYMDSLCAQRQDYRARCPSEELPLLWLLYRNYARQCHEPRDRIYSLLSLPKPSNPETCMRAIKVDYDDDITAVFYSVLEAVPFQDDAIFAHATALRRLLRLSAVLPALEEAAVAEEELRIDVAGFVDGEVMKTVTLDVSSGIARQGLILSVTKPRSSPSSIESLQLSVENLHDSDTYRHDWLQTWRHDQPRDGEHDLWSKVAEELLPPRENVYDEVSTLMEGLTQAMDTETQSLYEHSALLNRLNGRCFCTPHDVELPMASNKISLVVIRLRTLMVRGEEQDGVAEHVFRADNVLGLARGGVSVGDKVLSFPYAIPGFAFALGEQPTKHLTGAIQWIKPGHWDWLGYSTRMWHDDQSEDRFPPPVLKEIHPAYLYPKVTLKMTAQEILQLTPVLEPFPTDSH
jgi:hypothetical protein